MVEQVRQPWQCKQYLERAVGQDHHFFALTRQQAFVGSVVETWTWILARGKEIEYCLPLEPGMGFVYGRILVC